MKNLKYLFLFITCYVFSQDTIRHADGKITIVEKAPIYPGCEDEKDKRMCFQLKMHKHIVNHFKYPRQALKAGLQGKVFVNFVIEINGKINIIGIRSPDKLLENEAKRIMNKLPKFKPGKQNGKSVRMSMTFPIVFKLQ
jgi:protein TonB